MKKKYSSGSKSKCIYKTYKSKIKRGLDFHIFFFAQMKTFKKNLPEFVTLVEAALGEERPLEHVRPPGGPALRVVHFTEDVQGQIKDRGGLGEVEDGIGDTIPNQKMTILGIHVAF